MFVGHFEIGCSLKNDHLFFGLQFVLFPTVGLCLRTDKKEISEKVCGQLQPRHKIECILLLAMALPCHGLVCVV